MDRPRQDSHQANYITDAILILFHISSLFTSYTCSSSQTFVDLMPLASTLLSQSTILLSSNTGDLFSVPFDWSLNSHWSSAVPSNSSPPTIDSFCHRDSLIQQSWRDTGMYAMQLLHFIIQRHRFWNFFLFPNPSSSIVSWFVALQTLSGRWTSYYWLGLW